jgi:hypothetical protein
MTPTPPPPGPIAYRVVVRGRVTERLAASFEGMTIEPGLETSAIVGPVTDQSHLLGILQAAAGLGLDLISVTPDARKDPAPRVA